MASSQQMPMIATAIATGAVALGAWGFYASLFYDGVAFPVTNRFGWAQYVSPLLLAALNSALLLGAGLLTLAKWKEARWVAIGVFLATVARALWTLDASSYGRVFSPYMLKTVIGIWLLIVVFSGIYAWHLMSLYSRGYFK